MKILAEILGVKEGSMIDVSGYGIERWRVVGKDCLQTLFGLDDYEITTGVLLGLYNYRKTYTADILDLLNEVEQLYSDADYIIINSNRKCLTVYRKGCDIPLAIHNLAEIQVEFSSGMYHTSKYKIPWRMVVIDGSKEVEK